MKVLLVDDKGQQVASLENLEQYDAGKPGDLLALMNFMERLLATATATGSNQRRSSAA